MFDRGDIDQMTARGISRSQIEDQLRIFRNGLPAVRVMAAATIGHGILAFNDETLADYAKSFDLVRDNITIVKFVPASGQATRMFKFLFEFLEAI